MNITTEKLNNYILTFLLAVVLIISYFILRSNSDKKIETISPLNAVFTIEGQGVELISGRSETQLTPGSLTKVITQYSGNDVKYDFNSDGKQDEAFILTQQTGGTGVFYYLAASINSDTGYHGSEGFFLGDRISPQKVEMSSGGVIVVKYLERLISASFVDKPTTSKTVWFKFDSAEKKFNEIPQPYTGSGVEPSKATLDTQKWSWVITNNKNGSVTEPNDANTFVLVFKDSRSFSATTDCNGLTGSYVLNGNKISFSIDIVDNDLCPNSQELDFKTTLESIDSYHFDSNGMAVFDFKNGGGSAIFK